MLQFDPSVARRGHGSRCVLRGLGVEPPDVAQVAGMRCAGHRAAFATLLRANAVKRRTIATATTVTPRQPPEVASRMHPLVGQPQRRAGGANPTANEMPATGCPRERERKDRQENPRHREADVASAEDQRRHEHGAVQYEP